MTTDATTRIGDKRQGYKSGPRDQRLEVSQWVPPAPLR